MAERIGAAQAKTHFSALLAQVAYGGKQFIIERRGKPLAALVGLEELERLDEVRAKSARPLGALALVGGWREVGDEEIDAMVAHIYAEREKDIGRPVELEE